METKTLRRLAGAIREYRNRMLMAVFCRIISHHFKKYGK
jgi:hypothetical protein